MCVCVYWFYSDRQRYDFSGLRSAVVRVGDTGKGTVFNHETNCR